MRSTTKKKTVSPLPESFEPEVQEASHNNAVQDRYTTGSNLEFFVLLGPNCHMLVLGVNALENKNIAWARRCTGNRKE